MTDQIDIIQLAAHAMEQHGHQVTRHDTWLQHRDSGIVVRPHFLECEQSEGHVRSATAIMTSHPGLVPDGLSEFQHAAGATLSEAVFSGFDQWVQLDFPVFLDALRAEPEQCMAFEKTFPSGDDAPALNRRAVLGPVAHLVAPQTTTAPEISPPEDEHPFCPCCLLLNSYDTFELLLATDRLFGVRLLASRDQNGRPLADCRVNGAEWERGRRALIDYVGTWPQAGFEMRKQYVILQTLGAPGGL